MAQRPRLGGRQARRHPARASERRGDPWLRESISPPIRGARAAGDQHRRARRTSAGAGGVPRNPRPATSRAGWRAGGSTASPRSAPPGSTPRTRSARLCRPARARACSTASTTPARCACASPAAACVPSTPATSSCSERAPRHFACARLGTAHAARHRRRQHQSGLRFGRGRGDPRALADRDRSPADRRSICGVAPPIARARRLHQGRRFGGHHRHRRPARAPQSRSARRQIFRRHAAGGGAGAGGMGDHARRRRARVGRRRPGAQRDRRPRALRGATLIVIDFGTATTFDHVDFTGAYKGGIIAPGIQPLARRSGQRRRAAAAGGDRGARKPERDRPHHRGADAHRASIGAMSR